MDWLYEIGHFFSAAVILNGIGTSIKIELASLLIIPSLDPPLPLPELDWVSKTVLRVRLVEF